jgi:hypothetical protein
MAYKSYNTYYAYTFINDMPIISDMKKISVAVDLETHEYIKKNCGKDEPYSSALRRLLGLKTK